MLCINMKIILNIIINLLLSIILVQADIKRDCRKKTGVSWGKYHMVCVILFNNGDNACFVDLTIFDGSLMKLKAADYNQNDQQLKCYLLCFMQKNGIFDKDDINVEKALRHLPRGVQGPSKKTLEYCKKIPSNDACDKAFQLAKCYFKAQPEILKTVSFV